LLYFSELSFYILSSRAGANVQNTMSEDIMPENTVPEDSMSEDRSEQLKRELADLIEQYAQVHNSQGSFSKD
jgi:hypothetical protein